MMALAIVAVVMGIGVVLEMIAWAISTWVEAEKQDNFKTYCKSKGAKMVSFEEFSKMMKDTDLRA